MKLKHEPDALIAKRGQFTFRQAEHVLVVIEDGAARGSIQRSENVKQRTFPCAGRADHGDQFAASGR